MLRIEDCEKYFTNQATMADFIGLLRQAANADNFSGITYQGSRVVTLVTPQIVSVESALNHWNKKHEQQLQQRNQAGQQSQTGQTSRATN